MRQRPSPLLGLRHFHAGVRHYLPLFGFFAAAAGLCLTPAVRHLCRTGEKLLAERGRR